MQYSLPFLFHETCQQKIGEPEHRDEKKLPPALTQADKRMITGDIVTFTSSIYNILRQKDYVLCNTCLRGVNEESGKG